MEIMIEKIKAAIGQMIWGIVSFVGALLAWMYLRGDKASEKYNEAQKKIDEASTKIDNLQKQLKEQHSKTEKDEKEYDDAIRDYEAARKTSGTNKES